MDMELEWYVEVSALVKPQKRSGDSTIWHRLMAGELQDCYDRVKGHNNEDALRFVHLFLSRLDLPSCCDKITDRQPGTVVCMVGAGTENMIQWLEEVLRRAVRRPYTVYGIHVDGGGIFFFHEWHGDERGLVTRKRSSPCLLLNRKEHGLMTIVQTIRATVCSIEPFQLPLVRLVHETHSEAEQVDEDLSWEEDVSL